MTPSPFTYSITQHICRICLARVLHRETFEGISIYKCSNCGVEVESENVHGLCCCGIRLRNKKDAGIRCVVNDKRCPEHPAEIVAMQVVTEIPARV